MIAIGGENLIDFVNSPVQGVLPAYTGYPGGSPYNVAMAAALQGATTAYLTPISKDKLGNLLAGKLEECGVHLAGGRSNKPTSLAVVSLQDGIPSYEFFRNDTAERQVNTHFLDAVTPKDAVLFHVGSLGLIEGDDAIAWENKFVDWHRSGRLTSLDPNVRPSLISDSDGYRRRIRSMMGSADIMKLSDEDLLWLYPEPGFEAACQACFADSKAALTVITFPTRKFVDTVGAGDTFTASVLVWMLEQGITRREDIENLTQNQLENALKRAAIAAALNCERQGCQPPRSKDIDSQIA
ncbi:MAG: PfkB family carbohydrate kinase [Candidatus Puniceispirillaceae bacterium]